MKSIALAVSGVVVGALATWLVLGRLATTTTSTSAGATEHADMDMAMEDSEDVLYTCSMHPQVLEHEPGQCPICGMNLVPVTAGGAASGARREGAALSGPGEVRVDPGFVQKMGVRVETVSRRDIVRELRTVGILRYDERQTQWVTTKYEGFIEAVEASYLGDRVEKGQVLFEIYSPELLAAQKEYLRAAEFARSMEGGSTVSPQAAERARALVEAAKTKLRLWDVTDEQLEALEASGEARRTLPIVAPASGEIVEKMATSLDGMFVRPGMNLYQIVDTSTIWADVSILEGQIPGFQSAGASEARIALTPGTGAADGVSARVRFVQPFLDEDTRSLTVSLQMRNPGMRWKAGMYVDVTFPTTAVRDAVAVPEEAILRKGETAVVVIDVGEGRFQVREVTLGASGGGYTEVREGVAPDERIVVSGQFLIDSESSLREAIRKLGEPAPAPAHQH